MFPANVRSWPLGIACRLYMFLLSNPCLIEHICEPIWDKSIKTTLDAVDAMELNRWILQKCYGPIDGFEASCNLHLICQNRGTRFQALDRYRLQRYDSSLGQRYHNVIIPFWSTPPSIHCGAVTHLRYTWDRGQIPFYVVWKQIPHRFSAN